MSLKQITADLLVSLLISVLTIGIADAQQGEADAASQQVLASLRKNYPATKFERVGPAPVAGLYEVTLGKTIIYTDKDAKYWIFGYVFDPKTQTDLTAPKIAALDKVNVGYLQKSLAIRRVIGNGSPTLYVFADPNCIHCKALEPQLNKLDDVEILTFPVPILGADSVNKVKALWCAFNPAKAWSDWMERGAMPSSLTPGCVAPIEALMDVAQKAHVEGTPTMVAADGRKKVAGATAADITAWLNQGGSQQAQAINIKTP